MNPSDRPWASPGLPPWIPPPPATSYLIIALTILTAVFRGWM